MNRYKSKELAAMVQHVEGEFVLYTDAVEALNEVLKTVKGAMEFAVDHEEDILTGVNDYGDLKPLLDMVKGVKTKH